MAFYKTCPICGCNLDPGEKCACEAEREHRQKVLDKNIKMGPGGQYYFSFAKQDNGRR